MARIVLLLIRIFYCVPYYFFGIKKRADFEKYPSVEERYQFIRTFVHKIIKAAHVDTIVTGVENLPQAGGYLIAPNHQGMFDILMIADSHERALTTVGKKELAKVIFVKDIMAALPAIALDRSNLREGIKMIKQVGKEIAEGRIYIIFPEGTRSREGNKIGEFKGGTMKAAIDAKAPIVPAAVIDAFLPFDSKGIGRVKSELHYLAPIYYEEYKDLSSTEIATEVQNRIQNKINEVLESRK